MSAVAAAHEEPVASSRPALTSRQTQVLEAIRIHLREHGYAPTTRELLGVLGISSVNGVREHLLALEKKGYIARDDMKSRAIRILDPMPAAGERPLRLVALFEALGERPVGRMRVPEGREALRAELALRVGGDWGQEHGIARGDVLFVSRRWGNAEIAGRLVLLVDGRSVRRLGHDEIVGWEKRRDRGVEGLVVALWRHVATLG